MRPNLLNAILVEIKQINQSGTVYNDAMNEHGNVVKRYTKFSIKAQVVFNEDDFVDAVRNTDPRNLAGTILNSKGYIIVRKKDLKILGKNLSYNDVIISYGTGDNKTSCKYYLIGKKDAGQYADHDGHTLERWYFEDRN